VGIDNISVTAVPLPGAFWLMLGGLLPAVVRRVTG
jgi:hypothetical protein